MTRARCTFRESDVRRAIRAAEKAGKTVQRIEIEPDGKIAIVTGDQPKGKDEWANI